jgi:hypothetical protein
MKRIQKILLAAAAFLVLLAMAFTVVMIGSLKPTEWPRPSERAAPTLPPAAPAEPESASTSGQQPEAPAGSIRGGQPEISGDEGLKRMLAEALARDFPEIELTEDALYRLSEAVAAIRDSLRSLRAVERTPETAAALKALEQRRDAALIEFERITGVPFQELLRRASEEGGIDEEDADADEVVLLPLSPRP